jgi:hypothetical protein
MADALHTHGAVVSAQEARVDDGGLIAVQGPGALDVRTGVMIGPGATGVVTGTASTAPMRVAIAPHHWVTSRGSANGPYRGANEASRTVDIAAAPGSGTRTDVVYVKQNDATAGVPSPDATTGEFYGVVTGTVGAGKPTLPVGAEELATVAVSAGATATNGAGVLITNTARLTNARGAPIPVRTIAERDALPKWVGLTVQFVADAGIFLAGTVHTWNGTYWRQLGPAVIGVYDAPWPEAPGDFTANPQVLTRFTVPDPSGVFYRAQVHCRVEIGTAAVAGANTRWDLHVGYGGSGNTVGVDLGFDLGLDNVVSYQQAFGPMSGGRTGDLSVAAQAVRAYGDRAGRVAVNKRLTVTLFAA